MEQHTCPTCNGTRLKKESLWFKIDNKNIGELAQMDLSDLQKWFDGVETRLSEKQKLIAKDALWTQTCTPRWQGLARAGTFGMQKEE